MKDAANIENVKDKIADVNNQINKLGTKLYDLQKDRSVRESALSSETALRARVKQLEDWKVEVAGIDEKLKGKDEIYRQIEPLNDRMRGVNNAEMAVRNKFNDDKSALNNKLHETENLYSAALANYKEYDSKKKMIQKLDGLDCPQNCIYVADAVEAKKIVEITDGDGLKHRLDDLNHEIAFIKSSLSIYTAGQLNVDLEPFTFQVKTIQAKIDLHKAELPEFDDLEKQKTKLNQQIAAVESGKPSEKLALMDEHRKRIAELDKEITDIEMLRVSTALELESLKTQDSGRVHLDEMLRKNTEEKNRLENQKTDLNKQIAVLQEKLSDSAVAEMCKGIIETRIESLAALQTAYSRLSFAFSLKGMQALIIDSEKNQFLSIARELFNVLSGGEMALQFETQKANKDGSIREDFGLFLVIKGVKIDLKCCSGAQKALGRMVMRTTLGIFNGQKNSGMCESFFLDETTGSFDQINRENYFEYLKYITKFFSQILVITHQDVADVIPCRVTITEDRRLEIA